MTATLQLITSPQEADSLSPLDAPIRVVVADDHAMVRRTLRLLLDVEQDVDVIAEAVDLAAVMRHVSQHVPHVLVLDLRAPNGSSIETIRHLRRTFPETKVVVLTLEDSPLFRAAGHLSRRDRVRCQGQSRHGAHPRRPPCRPRRGVRQSPRGVRAGWA